MQMIKRDGNREFQHTSRSRQLNPKQAYNLLMRFLSNPCPSIAMMIIEHREDISRIVREYQRMYRSQTLTEAYMEGVALFLRAFDQVENVIDRYGFKDLEFLNDEERKLLKILRVDSC
jgi:hypothetical protein